MEKEDEREDEEPELEGRVNIDKYDFTSTTTQRPTEQSQVIDKCHLPYYPATDPDLENAWRFGIYSQRIFK